ncbi:unnamed protein product [Prorocentrum cordatum]|uniref:Pentatricopeptide repeat-containing protein, chloroplastic n=1 Tax=Prorocentrum cordatum TaxID=2364126 RepID=A0ABN9UVZ0_9DINO|nr:unnamed protein product [Polarella glacialis]
MLGIGRGSREGVISLEASIKSFGRAKQWSVALRLLREGLRLGVQLGPGHYIATASACRKGGQWQHALSVLSDMWKAKLEPDVISYSAGISACEKGEQWQLALAMLSEMWERALALLSEMWEAKLEPDVISYNAGISACEAGAQRHQLQRWDQRVREGRAVAAGACAAERDAGGEAGARRHQLQRWDQRVREGQMREAKLEPDVISYNAAICTSERCSQWRHAFSLLRVMRERHVETNDISYNLCITAYERSSRNLAGLSCYRCIGLSRFRVSCEALSVWEPAGEPL